MVDSTICKVACVNVTEWPGEQFDVKMSGAYPHLGDEDKKFHLYTPTVTMDFRISNPAISGFFKPGKKYYAEFREVPEGVG